MGVSLNEVYRSIGITKQGFHQMLNRQIRYNEEMVYVKDLLLQIRQDHPTMSCRAMYYKINPATIGRDKFERMCRELGFMVEAKVNYCRTTDSTGVVKFDNLIKDLEISRMNQVWSSDITYYEVGGIFYYLTFILDNYTRRIIGHNVSGRLMTEQTSLPAMKKAIRHAGTEEVIRSGIIFHSDGGGQYYDKGFLRLTQSHNFKNSMCEYAYENGKAERINGVIKNNYLVFKKIETLEQLIKEVDRTVKLYNDEKPHKSLLYKTPTQFEKECITLQKQTRTMAKESIDEKEQDLGASSPFNPEQTRTQTQDVISKKEQEFAFLID